MKKPTFKKPTFKRPTLPSLKPAPDPLKGLKPTDSVETDAAAELDAVQAGFRERAQQEAERFQDATDTGYYTCVVFSNRAQNDAFLEAIGKLGKDDLYLDGRDLARIMGIDLPPDGGGGTPGRIDKAFAGMVRDD